MKARFLLAAASLATVAGQVLAQDRTILPVPPAPFDGVIAENALDSRPAAPRSVRAPEGAPNVLLFMSDDVGFAMSSTFGGPVPTPNFERVAAMGQRYNRFHTTGICSPSRAALLTGRNHHNAGVGYLSDLAIGFPGYAGSMSPETATIAQVLRLNGYNTGMWGKHHNVPRGEETAAGPFDAWPTGLGFEHFFGFLGGDADQFTPPNLYRGIERVDPGEATGDLLDKRLADDIISWVHNQKAAAPDKPFLVYFAPGSTHAPHQAPPEYIARFKGRFDQGWDKVREETFRRQLASGIIPKGTKLTPRPDGIPAWDSLTPAQKAFASRTMEVAAAQLAYQDEQFGRVLNELQRMGVLDNTLVAVIQGDNGASAEAGPNGTINEISKLTGIKEDPDWLLANVDRLGGPMTYESYPAGWAWAMNTPLRWTKQFASMLGGVRNGMILSWKGHVARPGGICAQFGHLIDLAPTILDAAGLPAPATVLGVRQKPMDGQSLLPSLAKCEADKPRTQYFEIGGKAGLYHDGWFASMDDGRKSWENVGPGGPRPPLQWTLYDLRNDFSQGQDLSLKEPARMQAMIALWRQEAERNHVFPLDFRFGPGRGGLMVKGGRRHFDLWGKDVSLPAQGEPFLAGRSFRAEADLVLDKPDSSGVVLAMGSHFGGWSLFLDHGRPTFVFARSTRPDEIVRIASDKALPEGSAKLRLTFRSEGFGGAAEVVIASADGELARGRLANGFAMPAGIGETLDVGRDLGVTVTDYPTPRGRIEGDVTHVGIDLD